MTQKVRGSGCVVWSANIAPAHPSGAALLLALIRSDQMTAEQVDHLLADNPAFALWYRSA